MNPFRDGPRIRLFLQPFPQGNNRPQATWQNGIAAGWIERYQRELLHQVIAFNEAHSKRLFSDCVSYCQEDRTRLGLNKGTLFARIRSAKLLGQLIAHPRLGGFHRRHERAA
jgi:hypothetical protein